MDDSAAARYLAGEHGFDASSLLEGIAKVDTGVSIKSWHPLEGYRPATLAAVNGILVVLLNLLVTGLISTRLLRGHKKLTENLPLSAHNLYTGAISVLVEAAAPVAVTGLVWAILTVSPLSPQVVIAQAVFQALFQISAVS